LAALVASGISANAFYYVGFLPREPQTRRKFLRDLVNERDTLVAFETPHRLRDALEDLETIFGPARQLCVARELTKKFEEFQRGTIRQVRAYFQTVEPRGEFTFVIQGAGRRQLKETREIWNDARVVREIRVLLEQGVSRTDAVKQIAKASRRERRAVYKLMLGKKINGHVPI
jgi:16S rRNA (cytidine1402-2'-O)-methyltransferase